jgi:hypothetical protein
MGDGGKMIWGGIKESLGTFKGAFTATAKSSEILSEEREKNREKFKMNLGGEGDEVQGIGKGQNAFADSLRKIGGGGFAGGQGDPILDENKRQTSLQQQMVALLSKKSSDMGGFSGARYA